MELVDVEVLRWVIGVDGWYEAYPTYSSTTGYGFQQNGGNPVSGPEPASENAGAAVAAYEGAWSMPFIAAGPQGANLYFLTLPINPLYVGEYAVGAYQRPVIAMGGVGEWNLVSRVMPGAPATTMFTELTGFDTWCGHSDGTETAPLASSSTGWWNGLVCAVNFTTWRNAPVSANTSWTMEVTALDPNGAPTVHKMQPVIGVWNATDAVGTLPTVASQAAAMNSMSLGMTQLRVPAAATASTYRIALGEQYGGGRTDFSYTARILCLSGVAPATVGTAGGQITITGTGFQKGNQVTVNGVAAMVSSWTSTQIVATAPTMAAARATVGTGVDVVVTDRSTGGTTDMQGALAYSTSTADQVLLVSAPAALETGYVAATPFGVRVFAADGVTPAAGARVSFVVVGNGGGAAVATGCQSGPGCVVMTDATGVARTPLMGVAAGSVTVSGTEMSGGASVNATIADTNAVQTVTMGATAQYLAAGASGSWSLSLTAVQDGAAAVGIPVTWTTGATGFVLTPATGVTAANGSEAVGAQVGAVAGGSANVVTGCAWTAVCASWTVFGVAQSQWVVTVASGGGQSVARGVSPAVVKLLVSDGAGHALPGAAVNIYQTAYAWEGACAIQGACAAAPVLMVSRSSAVSDGSGMVQLTPMEAPGVAQVVRIAVATGTQGFATSSVVVE